MKFHLIVLLSFLLGACTDPKDTAKRVGENYVGKSATQVIQALGYPEDIRRGLTGTSLVSWYRTADRDDVVVLGPTAGVLKDTCRLTLEVAGARVSQFELRGHPEACARFAP
jgi:hypothetical protein